MSKSNDIMLIDECPTCGVKMKIEDPQTYSCYKCGEFWDLEELEYEPIQNKMDKWIKK